MISNRFYAAIDEWIATDTWHTRQSLDENRFYTALTAGLTDGIEGFVLYEFEDTLRQIIRRRHPGFDRDYVDTVICERVHRADVVFGYLKAPETPHFAD